MKSMLISFLVLVEIMVLNAGIYVLIRQRCTSLSRSFCYAAVLTLATLSTLIQVFFLLGIPRFYFAADVAVIVFSFYHILKNIGVLKKDASGFFNFLKVYKLILFIFLPIVILLFLQTFLLPPANSDSMVYNLARVPMFQQAQGLFLENYSFIHQAAFPVGYDILTFLFLRFNSDFGLAIFSFICYMILIAGTFSLAASFFNKKLALSVALVIASLTELILQSTTTKNDIPCAAVAMVIFLAGYSFFKNRGTVDFYLLIVCSLWGLTVKGYFGGFLAPFFLVYMIFLMKTLSFKGLKVYLKAYATSLKMKLHYSALLPLGLLVCMVLFYGNNIKQFGGIWGEKELVKSNQNNDGILGGVLNAGRYLVQSAEIPVKYGYKINELHDRFLQGHKNAGMRNRQGKIDLADKTFLSEDYTWYGPLGFFLVIPAIIFAIFFAKGYIRIVGLTLLLYFIIISFQLAWMPWNSRFFATFFAGSGLCIAYVFNRFLGSTTKFRIIDRFKAWGAWLIILTAVYGLYSTALQGDRKVTVPQYQPGNLIYNLYAAGTGALHLHPGRAKTGWFDWCASVVARKSHYEKFYPPHMLDTFTSQIEKGKKVLIMGYFAQVFPLLYSRPDLEITVATFDRVTLNHQDYYLANPGHYRVVRDHFDYLVIINKDIKKFDLDTNIQAEENIFYSLKGSMYKVKK
ncbi:MAG TPA: glycosyltransferase family 39 protein [Candidatus Deferrimicrobium sp.]|nr:glycosyltransferase family 39 protein [Candidatus Deferrimicrobium sp.]